MQNPNKNTRLVEIYTGAYASGKSEISVNRALMLNNEDFPVTLVDLDTVEPAYTLRPIKKELEADYKIKVVTQEDSFGLGEAGNVITPEQKGCLQLYDTNIVIDVGYGVGGLDILDVVNGIEEEENMHIYIVINTSKYETSTVELIVEYVKWSLGSGKQKWKTFSGIISNTHFGDETQKEDILKGFEITKKASDILNIPIRAITVAESNYPQLESVICSGVSVWTLKRFMPRAFW